MDPAGGLLDDQETTATVDEPLVLLDKRWKCMSITISLLVAGQINFFFFSFGDHEASYFSKDIGTSLRTMTSADSSSVMIT